MKKIIKPLLLVSLIILGLGFIGCSSDFESEKQIEFMEYNENRSIYSCGSGVGHGICEYHNGRRHGRHWH